MTKALLQIEVSLDRSPVLVLGSVMHELCAHALESQPEECCGLVLGSEAQPFAQIVRCRNEMTARHQGDPVTYPRDGRHAFYMSEVDYLKASTEAEARGERVTAVYHSHVGAGAYLSEMDLAFAEHALFPFPQAAQIVLAVWDRNIAAAGIFERDPESGRFVGSSLEVDAS